VILFIYLFWGGKLSPFCEQYFEKKGYIVTNSMFFWKKNPPKNEILF